MKNEKIVSSKAAEPVGLYPHARRVGNLLFLSGIGPRERGTGKIPGDFAAQCRAMFRNIRFVLEEAGARWEDLVDVTVFLTNMKKNFPTFNRLYAEAFADVQPCRTTIEVGALPTPIAVEMKCIAVIAVDR